MYLFLLLQWNDVQAQLKLAPNIYFIQFTDKNNSTFQLSKPEEFLSLRSLQRRQHQNISLQINDLPVNQLYVDSLRKLGFTILNTSKWHNAVSVLVSDLSLFNKLNNVSFVKLLNSSKVTSTTIRHNFRETVKPIQLKSSGFYGAAYNQIAIHHGDYLHEQGYRGQGMLIAVIDAGFYNANQMSGLDSLWTENRVKLIRDTYDPNGNVFMEDEHGAMVLSTMAADKPGYMVGTAPKADYLLLRSEYSASEYLIEEFNWSVAAELADSTGADIITTSLGYTQFDDSSMDHTYADMNGHTTLVSKSASIAASKGMIVVVSAGNEGLAPWTYISAPADADSILTVGAIGVDGKRAAFSSVGPSFDRRVKPDVVAVGFKATIELYNSSIGFGNGTSFSAPIMAGLTACLWQSCPGKNNMQIINAIRQSSSRSNSPDSLMGYGIPDFKVAYINLNSQSLLKDNSIVTWPNPFTDKISIVFGPTTDVVVDVSIFDITGRKALEKKVNTSKTEINVVSLTNLSSFSRGIYVIKVKSGSEILECKVLKM